MVIWFSMEQELSSLLPSAVILSLVFMIATKEWKPQSDVQDRPFFGRESTQTLPVLSEVVNHAKFCSKNPTRPFESVSADFFSVTGKSFLVVTDRLSGWPVVVPCKGDTTASNTIRIFCRYFREVGVPLRIRTDGGPQFSSKDFQDFMMRWGVHHIMLSPHYPQSNGHAEASVKAIKHLILKTAPSGNVDCEEFDGGLLELRNTPNFTGRSPAQILYGRPLRTCVPGHSKSFSEEWQAKSEDCGRRAAGRAEQVKLQYDQRARPLPKLEIGQTVRIQDPTSNRWEKVGFVLGFGKSWDYEVRLPSGQVWWCNRRFLHPVPTPEVDPLPHLPVTLARP
ncbi:uncharacterized protein [Palaemon carinicauda]|uniref:uncharacterized protein n=1 Tax=Palaemon carinicauda TaxID=392227 RepID=UPI0035B69020